MIETESMANLTPDVRDAKRRTTTFDSKVLECHYFGGSATSTVIYVTIKRRATFVKHCICL